MVIESQRVADGSNQGARSKGRVWRRRLIGLVSVLLVLALAGVAVVWFVLVPRYRPDLLPGEKFGLDVSNHQHEIDWAKVADDDISAVYIKATEGQDWVDKRFAENWKGSAAAGLHRGAYHFFSLCSPGAKQAANFLRTVPEDPEALPPVLDLEFAGCNDRPDKATFKREVMDFVNPVEEKTGKKVVLYAIPSFVEAYPLPAELVRDRWVRKLRHRPPTPGWSIWQVSDRARVHGITEPVDLDVFAPGTLP